MQTVSQLIKPKYIHEPHFDGLNFTPALFYLLGSATEEAATTAIRAGAVRVLEERQVAGYDAAILEADNAQSLNEWLATHGYEACPALVEWLEPYVKAHWKITAFKLAADGNRFATQPVRMSFTTDRPFFPYREPADLRGEKAPPNTPRALKIFLLSEGKVRSVNKNGLAKSSGPIKWMLRFISQLPATVASNHQNFPPIFGSPLLKTKLPRVPA